LNSRKSADCITGMSVAPHNESIPVILRIPMFAIFCLLLSSLRSYLSTRAALQAEILALRHQLLVLQRSHAVAGFG
jgi:hypothetical protein